ncbi:MAG: hypothetical protein HYY30_03545 [Chloroflexi bacterium]|nr:hypothetical protein [Chloroflexota bacterium]
MRDVTINNCFPCTSCCVWTEIPELAKRRGVPCRHLAEDGCRIYPQRPSVCREFYCYPSEMADFVGE